MDRERSDLHRCLDLAVKGNNPEVIKALIKAGSSPLPSIWEAVVEQDHKPKYRAKYLTIIDFLLTMDNTIGPEAVLTAIDNDNFTGLSRLLEKRAGNLDFDKHAVFRNPRWSSNSTLNCLSYAEECQTTEFVVLLGSYGWL